MKSQETKLDILLLHRQGLSCRQIARRTGSDPRTVKKYIEQPLRIGAPRKSAPRQSIVDAHRPMIESYLREDPDYRATWIFEKLQVQGYTGGYELVKRAVRVAKQPYRRQAYIRFETEPAQQAQVDFAEFQIQAPDGAVSRCYLFCLVLGYSRMLYAQLLERCDLPRFLQAHQDAFAALGGVPNEILYDRMRNVFVGQLAGKTQFTQELVSLANHYGFSPCVAPAYAPWVKGKVERPIDFVRESFWRGYNFSNLARANQDLERWCQEKAQRQHATTGERIDARFLREKGYLLALPPAPCDVSERLFRRVHKDCTIRVEGNSYVVPHTLVGKSVLVRRGQDRLRIFADSEQVAEYEMPAGKGHLVQDPRFYAALVADKEMQARKFHQAKKHKGRATISPSLPRYPLEVTPILPAPQVEQRSLSVYGALCGEVGYAAGEVTRA